jgi:probable HAF family extracellular repeat protein
MLRRTTFVVCALFSVLVVVGVASAATYTFTTLNVAGADTMTCAGAVNRVGGVPEVVGKTTSRYYWYNRGQGDIWDSTGTGTNINAYVGSPTYSSPTALDSSGNIVGCTYSATPLYKAFYLPAGSTSATTLPDLAAATSGTYRYSMAFGINAGKVAGYSYGADNNNHAVVWTNTGSWGVTDLGASGYASYATSINVSGVVAGMWTQTSGAYTGFNDPATWTWNGSTWVVNDLINRSLTANATGSAYALAINDNGITVGSGSIANFPSTNSRALKFNGDGTYTDLGNLGGPGAIINMPTAFPLSHYSASNAALGINNDGVIVGISNTTTTGSVYHAFIYGYNGVNTMQDMNTVFASIIPSGYTLTCATGIDNSGDIVGVMNNGTLTRGFLIAATVPEPSTLLLTATAVAGSLAYAWRKRKHDNNKRLSARFRRRV